MHVKHVSMARVLWFADGIYDRYNILLFLGIFTVIPQWSSNDWVSSKLKFGVRASFVRF